MAEVKKTVIKKESKGTKEPKETKVAKKVGTKAATKAEKQTEKVQSSLKINVLDTEGKATGTMMLPEAVFGAKVNPTLMAQAVRVYLANQRQGNAKTKTRGEIAMTTAKWYRQKGTGRARHGAKSAPIFVKGGVAHGPKLRDYTLSMPVKMRRAALFSALTTQLQNGNIVVVTGLEKLNGKTKTMAQSLKKINADNPSTGSASSQQARSGQVKSLVVMPSLLDTVYKAGRNIKGVSLTSAHMLSAYEVLGAGKIVFMKDAIATLEKTFSK